MRASLGWKYKMLIDNTIFDRMNTMNVPSYPTIERRENARGKLRFYVVGVPTFEGAQLHGFKSEESLMRCWNWWYNNSYLKGQPAKEARKEWAEGGRESSITNRSRSWW